MPVVSIMPILSPNTIIHDRYLIVRQIGQGGMGAIYEAIDQHLGNRVAVKQTLVSGAQLDKAFEREAKLLASLHHPALPVVSDYFIDAGGQFLVMQFIPGDDLATLLHHQGGPFPSEQVLGWADQLLDALDYLHTQEPPIIHRDIKPQNLKLTPRGSIVLLDFGLAKGAVPQQSHLTGSSSIFGYTPQYAPLEQIRGSGTDGRSDLYALAATLYHLLTNSVPTDALTRVAANVRREPDPLRPPHELNPALSQQTSAVLQQALALDPDQRVQSALALRTALQTVAAAKPAVASGTTVTGLAPTVIVPWLRSQLAPTARQVAQTVPTAQPSWRRAVIAGGVALLMMSLLIVTFFAVRSLAPSRGSVPTAAPAVVTHPETTVVPASPTGRIAFMTNRDGNQEIYAIDVNGSGLANLTNDPANDTEPAWSPDGTRIAFSSTRDGNPEIYVMNADGSGQQRLTTDPNVDGGPAWSPDGTRIAFSSGRGGGLAIYLMNADGTEPMRLSPPTEQGNDTDPAWSPDGTQLAFVSTRDFSKGSFEIYLINRDGTGLQRLTNNAAIDGEPAWSPDGTQIAFISTRSNQNGNIYLMNADGTDQKPVATSDAGKSSPGWSPDSQWIVFASLLDAKLGIYVMDASGSNQRPVVNDAKDNFVPSWSP
jgi:Tol biopolymer transport system component